MSPEDRRRSEPALPGAQDDVGRLAAELARVSALLDEERDYFRSELARGAEELAARDDLVERLRARCDELGEQREALVVRRDTLLAQKAKLVDKRDRLLDQRNQARAELERYQRSRVVRLAARVVWRAQRLRRRG